MKGQHHPTDDFVSNTVNSRYFTPLQFKNERFGKKQLSMAHLNIASLQSHIEELRTLLTILEYPFDVIAITETRLHEQEPLIDIALAGYNFIHTPTKTQNGGAALYIKKSIEYDMLNNMSVSIEDVCESIFIEVKSKKHTKYHYWMYISPSHSY